MKRTASPARRALPLALSVLALSVFSCGNDNASPASQVKALRILAVTADRPYAAPGDAVTFRMTYADALDKAGSAPRPVQITWLGGCVNPRAGRDEYLACFGQLGPALAGIVQGATELPGLLRQEVAPVALNGVPDAVSFELPLSADVLARAEPTETGTVYSTAYVFFAACAGTTRIASAPLEAGFPLECVDAQGTVLGPDSFVAGYTQVYVFADGRKNDNPPIGGIQIKLDGGESDVVSVARCEPSASAEEPQGCSQEESDECTTYKIGALVEDVAEVDVESAGLGAPPVHEAIWVDYYADGGEFSGAKKLVSDTVTGYREDHAAEWTPPSEAGTVTLWAVAHDTRGGTSVTRRSVQVD